MIVHLYSTEGSNCDLNAVARLVNDLQYFFVVRVHSSVRLPTELHNLLGIDPVELSKWIQTFHRSDTLNFVVLATSARLNLPKTQSLCHFGAGTAAITDHHWVNSIADSIVQFAKHVIQAGMAAFDCHQFNVDSCVCKPSEDFDCLCENCEKCLRSKDYRDGVVRLKEAFNVFNQLRWRPETRLPEIPLESGLRLATEYANEISETEQQRGKPALFEGVMILVVLHFLSDLIPFVEALRRLGCRYEDMYLVAKPYPYARRDEVSHRLTLLGVTTLRASKSDPVEQCSGRILSMVAKRLEGDRDKKVLVIEDGGYFAPLMHQTEFAEVLKHSIGVVEQTQKGTNTDREKIGEANIRLPILNVAESSFKKVYESPEIGRVAIQNIARFTPNIKLSGEYAVIFGFGSVGQEVAWHLNNSFNMTVSVVDDKDIAVLRARHRKAVVAEAEKDFAALKFGESAALVVGTTGRESINEAVLTKLRDGAILVSTSSDRREIATDALERLAHGRIREVTLGKHEYTIDSANGGTKKLTLLAEGYPINFYGSESLPNDTIDPVMTLLLLCGAELVLREREGHPFPNGILTAEVDQIAEARNLVKRFLERSASLS